MSVFSVGGNAGFALGPVLATPILLLFGLRGGWAIALVPLAAALALTVGLPRVAGHRPAPAGPQAAAAGGSSDRWGAFLTLTGAILSRSILFYGLNTFVPLYWIGVLHQSPGAGGVALATLLIAGAAGTLLGGRLGDRFSRRSVVLASLAVTGPLLLAVLLSSRPLAAGALLVPLGLCLYVPSSVMVVLGQEYLPSRMGTASGVTLGLALSVGGVVTPGLGFVADHAGLRDAMLLLLTMPLLATALALRLPR
jgi:FSR family fosmidomycin resistance protein-like MFS transporter